MLNKNKSLFDQATQVLLPILTIAGFWFTANKNPQLGFTFQILSQIFWLRASYRAWKDAGQIGIMVTAVLLTAISIYGLINWTLNP